MRASSSRIAARKPAAKSSGGDAISARWRRASAGNALASAMARRAFLAWSWRSRFLGRRACGGAASEQADRLQGANMLAREPVELVIRARAAGILAGLLGDGVGRRPLGVLLADLPDGGEPGLIAEVVDGVPHTVDAHPER